MSTAPWSAFEPANVSFCEPRISGWIAEPANAWSSVAYIVIAAWLLLRARSDRRHVLLLIPAASFLVGVGSFALHATATFVGQFSDEASMFLISGLMVTLAMRRLRQWSASQSTWCYVLLCTLSTVLLALVKTSGILVFAAQIGTTMLLETYLAVRRVGEVRYRALWAVLGMYTVASFVWLSDIKRIVCFSSSAHVFNGHVVWHVLTACCLAVYYAYQAQFVGQAAGAERTTSRDGASAAVPGSLAS